MNSSTRRVRSILAAAVAGGLVLVGCGSSGGDNATGKAPAKPGKVTGSVVMAEPGDNPGDLALRRQLAASFMKAHPGVKVSILVVPALNYSTKVQTMIAGGRPPDIFNSGDVEIANIVQKNFATDLKPYATRDKYSLSDFYPQVIDGLTYNNKLVGLTDNWDTQVMYYNESLFKAAGVPTPTADWTWADFVNAARKLTSGSGTNKKYGAVFDNWWAATYNQIWSDGGEPFPGKGTKCGYDSKQSITAFDQIVSLYKSGLSPTPSQFTNQGAEQQFLTGRVAMMLGSGRWAAYDLRDVKKFTWKVAPVPKGSAGRSNFFHLSMFAIPRTSKNPEAAWEFLKYMVSPTGINQGLAAAQGIPSRQSIANSAAFKNSAFATAHNSVQPFLESLPTVHKAPYLPNFNQINDTVTAELAPIWSLKSTPAQVLPAVCQKVDPLLKSGSAPGGG